MTDDLITIAAIHATIISVILGFLSAYFFFARALLASMEQSIISEAQKVNDLQFSFSQFHPTDDEVKKYDARNEESRKSKTFEIAVNTLINVERDGPEKTVDKCKFLLRQINLIVHRYPFPIYYEDPPGKTMMTPVDIGNIEKVRQWCLAVNHIHRMLQITRVQIYSDHYRVMFDEYKKTTEWDGYENSCRMLLADYYPIELDPQRFMQGAFRELTDARRLALPFTRRKY